MITIIDNLHNNHYTYLSIIFTIITNLRVEHYPQRIYIYIISIINTITSEITTKTDLYYNYCQGHFRITFHTSQLYIYIITSQLYNYITSQFGF